MRIVVTGASGFLGGAIVRKITKTGFDCVGVSRREIPGQVRVASYADSPVGDVLIHLAEVNDRVHANQLSAEYEQKASSTLQVLLKKGYPKVIYASSAVLYGDRVCTPHIETDPVNPIDTYTRVKMRGEHSVLARDGLVVRFGNIYGPRMAAGNVLSLILGQLDRDGPIRLDDTTHVRDFLWIEDAADAVVKMLDAPVMGLFNVGTGVGVSIRELAQTVLEVANQPEREILSKQVGTRESCVILDITKALRQLDWHPTVSLKEGLTRLISA